MGTECVVELLVLLFLPWVWIWVVPTYVKKVKQVPFVKAALGATMPGLIILTERSFNASTLRHEDGHIRQMRKFSPLGLLLIFMLYYAKEIVVAVFKRQRFGFWESWKRNPFEVEASERMHDETYKMTRMFGDKVS